MDKNVNYLHTFTTTIPDRKLDHPMDIQIYILFIPFIFLHSVVLLSFAICQFGWSGPSHFHLPSLAYAHYSLAFLDCMAEWVLKKKSIIIHLHHLSVYAWMFLLPSLKFALDLKFKLNTFKNGLKMINSLLSVCYSNLFTLCNQAENRVLGSFVCHFLAIHKYSD